MIDDAVEVRALLTKFPLIVVYYFFAIILFFTFGYVYCRRILPTQLLLPIRFLFGTTYLCTFLQLVLLVCAAACGDVVLVVSYVSFGIPSEFKLGVSLGFGKRLVWQIWQEW